MPFVLLASLGGCFLGVLVTGIRMLASDVTSCTSVSTLVFSRIIWLCSCIAYCLITGRRPDRTSWVAPGVRVVHGHRGGLTTIGAGAGAGAGADIAVGIVSIVLYRSWISTRIKKDS